MRGDNGFMKVWRLGWWHVCCPCGTDERANEGLPARGVNGVGGVNGNTCIVPAVLWSEINAGCE